MTGRDLDMPFEEIPGGPVNAPLDHPLVAGGVVVRAAVLPTNTGPGVPALIFDFHLADGTAMPPIVFVSDADQMGKLAPLVEAASRAAIAGAEVTS